MRKHWVTFLIITLAATAADVISKYATFDAVPYRSKVDVIPGVLAFHTISNSGIIFGQFQGHGKLFLIISIIAIPIIVGLFATIKHPKWLLTLSLGLILAGTCGNMYDRLLTFFKVDGFEGVRDFIEITVFRWPIFNLADSYICIGVLLLAIDILFGKDPQAAPVTAAAPQVPGPTAPSEGAQNGKSGEVDPLTSPERSDPASSGPNTPA